MFSLGNIGYDKESPTFLADSACINAVPTNVNGTCIHVASLEFTATDASNILTACELLQIIIFLLFVRRLHKKSKKLMKDNENDECTVRDYSIMVTHLPVDITPTDLLIHFNKWQLGEKDWLGRPRVAGAKKVQSVENSMQVRCTNLIPYGNNNKSIFIMTAVCFSILSMCVLASTDPLRSIHLVLSSTLFSIYVPPL